MKVLVTGSTGFIGYYVIHNLLQRGINVIATSSNIDKAQQKDWYNRVVYVEHKIGEDKGNLFQKFHNPDYLIHLAWEGLPNYKSPFHIEENLPKQISFIEKMIETGLKNISITGTCFEYGMQEGCLSEDLPTIPNNAYAIAKDMLRKKIECFKESNDFSYKWIRLFYMYGKGQNPQSLLSQLDLAIKKKEEIFNMSGGQQIRDYLPVETVAKLIVTISLQDNVTGVINCCSGEQITVQQLVEKYLKVINKNIKLNLGFYSYSGIEPFAFWGSINKLKKII